jgi:hypothetical protein
MLFPVSVTVKIWLIVFQQMLKMALLMKILVNRKSGSGLEL